MHVRLLGKVMIVKPVQRLKAFERILVTLSGIEI